MAEADNVVSAGFGQSGDLLGSAIVKVISGEEGDAVKLGGVGLGGSLGGGETEDADDSVTKGEGGVGVKDQIAVAVGVGAEDVEVGTLQNGHEVVIAVVELVVADAGEVITGEVHELDGGGTLGDAYGGVTLDVVAGVEKQNVGAARLVVTFHGGNLGVTVDSSVHVVGVQDDDLACKIFRGLLSSQCAAAEGEHQSESQENR